MRIIFLDIDGVLNKALVSSGSEESDILEVKPYGWMNKSLVENLNEITTKTGAKIVVSSTWRRKTKEENQEMLKAFGVTGEVIGQTPHLGKYTVRGNEIKAWLVENKEVIGCWYWDFNQYVIIDDDSDMLLEQANNFINTDPWIGLSKRSAYKAIRKLETMINAPKKDKLEIA